MLRAPSRRKRKEPMQKLNLIPILDSVFIFIFFLLMSANFIKIFEIPSKVPLVSSEEPPRTKKKILSLTVKMTSSGFEITRGEEGDIVATLKKTKRKYPFEKLNSELSNIKREVWRSPRSYADGDTVSFEPTEKVPYIEIVRAMDSMRIVKKRFIRYIPKKKDGTKDKVLFTNLVFGNIQS